MIILSDYGSGIAYGGGNATKDATQSEYPIPSEGIGYGGNAATFNSRGMGSTWGYVYTQNSKGTAAATDWR